MAQNHGNRLPSLTACDSAQTRRRIMRYFQYRIDTAREKGMEGVVEPTINAGSRRKP